MSNPSAMTRDALVLERQRIENRVAEAWRLVKEREEAIAFQGWSKFLAIPFPTNLYA